MLRRLAEGVAEAHRVGLAVGGLSPRTSSCAPTGWWGCAASPPPPARSPVTSPPWARCWRSASPARGRRRRPPPAGVARPRRAGAARALHRTRAGPVQRRRHGLPAGRTAPGGPARMPDPGFTRSGGRLHPPRDGPAGRRPRRAGRRAGAREDGAPPATPGDGRADATRVVDVPVHEERPADAPERPVAPVDVPTVAPTISVPPPGAMTPPRTTPRPTSWDDRYPDRYADEWSDDERPAASSTTSSAMTTTTSTTTAATRRAPACGCRPRPAAARPRAGDRARHLVRVQRAVGGGLRRRGPPSPPRSRPRRRPPPHGGRPGPARRCRSPRPPCSTLRRQRVGERPPGGADLRRRPRHGLGHAALQGSAHFGNLKPGVGVLYDLGSPQPVGGVNFTTTLPGATVEVRTGATADGGLDAYTVAGTATLDPTTQVRFPRAVTSRYVLVWFTGWCPTAGRSAPTSPRSAILRAGR